MISSKPFLVHCPERCLLCNSPINEKEKKAVHEAGLQTIRNNAVLWSQIDERVCQEDPYRSFRGAIFRLPNEFQEALFIHQSCGITFRNKVKAKQSQSDSLRKAERERNTETQDICTGSSSVEVIQRKRLIREKSNASICVICNTKTDNDENAYNDGGLARCSEQRSAQKLKKKLEQRMANESDTFYEAAKRLDILLSGTSHDVFAADVFYHKNCYSSFTYTYTKSQKEATTSELESRALESFDEMFRRSVIEDKESYLMTELLKDLKEISQDYGLQVPPIRFTSALKAHLQDTFADLVSFSKVGKFQVAHSSLLGPVCYVEAAMKGHGMREDDLTKAFARLVQRKLESKDQLEWPPTPDQVCKSIENLIPLSCIFNAIAWSINPNKGKDHHGLVKVGKRHVEKVTALSQSWEAMVTGERAPLNIALGLTVHRLTGSKETSKLLHHAGIGISYSDVRMLNNIWAKSVKMDHKHMLPPGFINGKTIHVTFDNSDGKQQTLTGTDTTHHTTGTVFQISKSLEKTERREEIVQNNIVDDEKQDYGSYKIPRNRKDPPSFPDHIDEFENSPLIEESLKKDFAWALTNTIGTECLMDVQRDFDNSNLEAIGSWTCFMKKVTSAVTNKCKLEYLPVVPFPPKDNVIKWYMDSILQMVDDLAINHVFVHADEAINSKMLIISWLHDGKYDKIVTLMGGFHTILVSLKILGKKFACLGLRNWWIDAGIIAEGSVDKAMDGRHYHRSVRLHKQSFEALLHFRIKQLTKVHVLDNDLKESVAALRVKQSPATLASVLAQPAFQLLFENALSNQTGTQAKMIVEYLRDVSAMLCLISSVRENSIERHLAAERVLIPKCFAFGHQNYSRYLSFQHVKLLDIKRNHPAIWDDLLQNGFGGSISGEPFSTVHGDLITETTINREVKTRGGPMQGGFSTDITAVDTFMKTSHIIANLRVKLKERLKVFTKSSHNETSKGARKKHDVMTQRLVSKLDSYFDPFLAGPARHFKTGIQIDQAVINGLLSSTQLGNGMFQEFVETRLKEVDDRISIFERVCNPKLKTGLEKPKKVPKIISSLKEDRQAFGAMTGRKMSPEELLSYPLTSVPLALASPDGDLRQGSKASLRNHLIEDADALTTQPATGAFWIVDGMAVVRSILCKETWGEYATAFFSFCTPGRDSFPLRLGIVFDCYKESNIKQLTQLRRGMPGRRVFITSPHQSMPKQNEWSSFLHNPENKTELIHFLVSFLKENQSRLVTIPTIITENEKSWLLTPTRITELEDCNHYEADTRLICVATQVDMPVIIRATDTDVLILMVHIYSWRNIDRPWQMKIDHESFVDISAICGHIGSEACNILPAFHSITGCDTTSFPFRAGKVVPGKLMKLRSYELLSTFGSRALSDDGLLAAKQFFQKIVYNGEKGESYIETRVRMYQKQKVKSSEGIIPDENSTLQHLKRCWLQCYIWCHCTEKQIDFPPIDETFGWRQNDGFIQPLWYSCSQFPPDLSDVNEDAEVNGK